MWNSGILASRHRDFGFFLRFDNINQDRITIAENWGTVSNFKIEFDIKEFNDTSTTTYILLKHGNDFRADPSLRLGIVGNKIQVFIRNTGGTIETVISDLITLPFSGLIRIENNSLWVNDDEYPITYNLDTTWNDEVQTFIAINNNLTAPFKGDIKDFETPKNKYLLNSGVGDVAVSENNENGNIQTSNAGGINYINSNMWQKL